MRTNPDGSITYPQRGRPPAVPEGYDRDPGDPFRLIMKMPECQYREQVEQVLPCKKVVYYAVCILGHKCNPQECINCIKTGRRPN